MAGVLASSTSSQHQHQHQYASPLFSWQDTPEIAARCLRHQHLQWSIHGATLLGSDPRRGAAVVKLQLPRVVAGLYPVLEEVLHPSDSPLPQLPTAAHDAVLGVLRSLAQHAEHGTEGLLSSDGSTSVGITGTGSELHSLAPNSGERSVDGSVNHPQQFGGGGNSSSGAVSSNDSSSAAAASSMELAGSQLGSSFQIGSQLLVLLSADSAALGIFQDGRLVQHKVLTGYTVRRKQGKAQLTYGRQGGGEPSLPTL